MRPDAGENSQISPSTIVRPARVAGSNPHLASVLLQRWKSANITPVRSHPGNPGLKGKVGAYRAGRATPGNENETVAVLANALEPTLPTPWTTRVGPPICSKCSAEAGRAWLSRVICGPFLSFAPRLLPSRRTDPWI